MNIVFRADASLTIGTGHVSRCLTLAESLKRRGAHITFICAAGSPAFVPRLAEVADVIIELPHLAAEVEGSPDDTWLTVASTIDATATIAALSGRPVDWLVVDHYGIDARWESQLRPFVDRVMVIDDLANRRHDCDLLLDQNLRTARDPDYSQLVSVRCLQLIGPRFTLLRKEFLDARKTLRARNDGLQRVLISFGGSDSANLTSLALDALELVPISAIDVVIGATHPHRANIERRCAGSGWNCHVQTTEMARLITQADLAIGASGASAWERCFLGLPSVVVVAAENQALIAKNLEMTGAACSVGPVDGSLTERLRSALAELVANPALLQEMATCALKVMNRHESVDRFILGPTCPAALNRIQ